MEEEGEAEGAGRRVDWGGAAGAGRHGAKSRLALFINCPARHGQAAINLVAGLLFPRRNARPPRTKPPAVLEQYLSLPPNKRPPSLDAPPDTPTTKAPAPVDKILRSP
jgi:hypothetical protein